MDTYVVVISMSGILALISGVALLTFHDDLGKFFRFRMLKLRRSRKNRLSASADLRNMNNLLNEKGDSYYFGKKRNPVKAHRHLNEENGVI
jgi:hypothetical protein